MVHERQGRRRRCNLLPLTRWHRHCNSGASLANSTADGWLSLRTACSRACIGVGVFKRPALVGANRVLCLREGCCMLAALSYAEDTLRERQCQLAPTCENRLAQISWSAPFARFSAASDASIRVLPTRDVFLIADDASSWLECDFIRVYVAILFPFSSPPISFIRMHRIPITS